MTFALLEKIHSKKALIGVIGLGYVGLPLVREFTGAGMKVLGFDIDPTKVKALMAGKSYIEHIPAKTVQDMLDSRLFGEIGRAHV